MTPAISESKPLVAVILVAYGGIEYTKDCIDSLKKSNYENLKIILVDNNSPDNTRKYVKENYPDVVLIESEKNLGFAGGNNLGIDKALEIKADFIFLLNNDTEVAPDSVSNLVSTLKNSQNVGLIGPMIYYHSNRDLIWSAGGQVDFRFSYLKHRGIRERDKGQYSQSDEVDYLSGCAIMFPASIVKAVGKLDESFWMYYEDADFCLRIRKTGMKIIFEPKSKIWHKISSSTGGNLSTKKMWFKFMSGWRFFDRYSNYPFWFITYPFSQFVFFIMALMRFKR